MRRNTRLRLSMLAFALLIPFMGAVARQPFEHSAVNTTNPYTGEYGPPNCTWYAWQRAHDVDHVDLQFTDNAGAWLNHINDAHAAWSESASTFIALQANTTPQVGDVAVFPYQDGVWAYTTYGHVAFVDWTDGANLILSEQSYGDTSPGVNTKPYPYTVTTSKVSVAFIQHTQQGHARFLHFSAPPGGSPPPPPPPPPIDGSQWVANSAPQNVSPGQAFSVSFTFLNTGTTTWADPDYQLVCDQYYHQSNNTCMGASTIGFGGQQALPGQQFTFTVPLTAPTATGAYLTWWDVADKGGIFGSNNNYVVVNVVANTPPPLPTPTPPPPPTPTPVWQPYFSQTRPYCDDPSPWNGDANGSATDDCSSANGLVLSQYGHSYAELDLDHPNGNGNYNQSLFQVSVQAGFLDPANTGVYAALLVQTPQDFTQHSGYLLAINAAGSCQIQQVQGNGAITSVAPCQAPGIDPSSVTLQITVQNGQLTATINGQQAGQISDSLNPSPGAVSLMEESPNPTSSAILFSHFLLSFHS